MVRINILVCGRFLRISRAASKPVPFGHTEIQDRHIRPFHCLPAVPRFGYDFPVEIFLEDCANTSAKDNVVIGYEDANARHLLPLGRELHGDPTSVPFFRLGGSDPPFS